MSLSEPLSPVLNAAVSSAPAGAEEAPRFSRRYLWGIALFCGGGIALQLLLTRLFSVTLAYHFAFMVISIVMLSLAAPGAFIFALPRTFRRGRVAAQVSGASLAFGLMLFAVLAGYLAVHLRVASPHMTEWMRAEGKRNLVIIFALWMVPFLVGGFVPALLMSHFPRRAASLYGWDLAGAGLGGVLYVILLSYVSGVTALILVAALFCATAALFAGRERPKTAVAGLVSAAALAAFAPWNAAQWPEAPVRIRYTKYYAEPTPAIERWSPTSRITLFDQTFDATAPLPIRADRPFGWAMSKNAPVIQPKPREMWMEQDASAGTPVTAWDGRSTASVEHILWDLPAVAHALRTWPRALIIGSGGGRDVLAALAAGSRDVTAVEMNPATWDITRNTLKEFTGGLFSDPRVTFVNDEGRNFLRSHRGGKFDLIQISLVDSQAASATGALVFVENLLYTKEAFGLYYDKLAPGGAFAVGWYFIGTPPGSLLRMLAGVGEALRERGIEAPERHILLFRNGPGAAFIVRREPVSEAERAKAREEAGRLAFELVHDGSSPAAFPDLMDVLHNPSAATARYPVNLNPATDDSPFWLQLEKWGADPRSVSPDLRGFLVATRILRPLMGLMLVAGAVLVLGPLAVRTARSGRAWRSSLNGFPWMPSVAVCLGCGVGYLLVEIAMMHLGVKMVGYPAHAILVVLVAMLLGSGAGSIVSGRLAVGTMVRMLVPSMLGLAGLVAVLSPLTGLLYEASAGWAWGARAAALFVLSFGLGAGMGMPFPTLLRLVGTGAGEREEAPGYGALLPWLWGLNGVAGVVASVAVMYLAIFGGYSLALITGAVCYALVAAGFAALALRPQAAQTGKPAPLAQRSSFL